MESIYKTPESDLLEQTEELKFAGFWIRVAASIVDSLLIMLLTLPLLSAIYGVDYWTTSAMSSGIWDTLISYILPAVVVILFWIYKSATPGKMLFKLEVISLGDNKKISSMQAIGRYLGYFPAMIVLFLGFIWVAFDKRKQGWHDKMANTAVVKKS